MCFYIGIEDLAANALIEILRHEDKKFVSYKELENYGAEVVKILSDNGDKAILILSRKSTDALFRNYSKFFEENQIKNECGIILKDDISVEMLEEAFRGYLSLNVLMAFIAKSSVLKLGVHA